MLRSIPFNVKLKKVLLNLINDNLTKMLINFFAVFGLSWSSWNLSLHGLM